MTLKSDPVILVAEDNDDDVALLRRAFHYLTFSTSVHFLSDGRDVVSYLRGNGDFADRRAYPLPAIVLLDLALPGIDGFDVLKWWRRQRSLAAVRFVVLATAETIQDTNEAFRLGAASFLVKPVDFDELRNTLFELIRYGRARQASRPDERLRKKLVNTPGTTRAKKRPAVFRQAR